VDLLVRTVLIKSSYWLKLCIFSKCQCKTLTIVMSRLQIDSCTNMEKQIMFIEILESIFPSCSMSCRFISWNQDCKTGFNKLFSSYCNKGDPNVPQLKISVWSLGLYHQVWGYHTPGSWVDPVQGPLEQIVFHNSRLSLQLFIFSLV